MKTLKQILEVYSPKSADEKRFMNKHITIKNADRNGNGDDVFNATNVKTIDRAKEKKGHDAKASEAVYEGADQLDEISAATAKSYLAKKHDQEYDQTGPNTFKSKKPMTMAAATKSTINKIRALKRMQKEDIEQVDELKKSTLASYASKASKSAAGLATTAMHHKNYSDQHYKLGNKKQSDEFDKHSFDATEKQIKRQKGVDSALKRLAKEDVEVNEVLKVSAGAGEWIKDFQDSENPKFSGKSKEQRKKQALAAFYAAKRSGKE